MESAASPWQSSICAADELLPSSSPAMDADPISLQLQYALLGSNFREPPDNENWGHNCAQFDNYEDWLQTSVQWPHDETLDYCPSFPSLDPNAMAMEEEEEEEEEDDPVTSPRSNHDDQQRCDGIASQRGTDPIAGGTKARSHTKTQRSVGTCPPSSRKRAKRRSADPSEPKYLIVTRSEVEELLDDGFRWRKYGQKRVKNSVYPSHMTCTAIWSA